MKILQSSNIHFGRSFQGICSAGDKLRAGIKSSFSRIIDIAKDESVDLAIFSGDIFDSLDVSQSLLEFFISEISRLETIPAVVIPGIRDPYENGSFWEQWKILPPVKNLHILYDGGSSQLEIPEISTTIYVVPATVRRSTDNPLNAAKRGNGYRIAVTIGDSIEGDPGGQGKWPIQLEALSSMGFHYIALGGRDGLIDFTDSGVKAAYSGSPVVLSPDWNDSGNILLVELHGDSLEVLPRKLEGFNWKEIEIPTDTVVDTIDLKNRILEFEGQNTLLKLTLTGLTLLEAGLNPGQLKSELEEDFLHLEVIDKTSVLPENISEVKVREKTMLGQYLRVTVDRLNSAEDHRRGELEESLKIGYTLLSGGNVW